MDFNTGTGGTGGPGGSSQQGPGAASARASVGSPAADFNVSDPIGSFVDTARRILTQPVGFFQSIPRQGNLLSPLIFALICVEITFLISGFIGAIVNVASGAQGIGGAFGGYILFLIVVPLLAAASLFVAAGIYHLLVILIIRPVNSGFEGTFRVLSYSSVTSLATIVTTLLGVIPIIGPILSLLVSLAVGVVTIVLHVLGFREVHSATTGRAAAVALIPPAVALIVALLVGVLLVALLAALFSQ